MANKWQKYERKKKELQRLNLSPKEYDKRLAEIAKRLGV